jgi:hypothetical protein
VIGLGSALALGVSSTAIAAPAPLPPTDALFTIECDDASGTVPPLQLFSINPTTAVLTAIGTGDPTVGDSNCGGPTASVDPTTNLVYFIDQTRDNTSLTRMDATTGLSTVIAEFRLASDPTITYDAAALTIDPWGDAFVVNQGDLARVDLTTGRVTPIGDGNSESLSNIYALVAHPSTGVIYGISSSGPGVLYTFDPTTGTATEITTIAQTGIYGAAFDSAGTLWVTNYVGATGETELASVDVANWATSYAAVGGLTLGANPTYADYYTQSLFLTSEDWPEVPPRDGPDGGADDDGNQLAATGSPTESNAVLLGASFAALVAGGVLLAVRRRTIGARQ